MDDELFLWSERYRPHCVDDIIIPSNLKETFQKWVESGNIPNLLLAGPPGSGKTTAARAMLEQIGCDYLIINGSLTRGIDMLRHDIQRFASSISLTGGRKYIILDEADYLTPDTQAALRNFMETYSKNCGFIFTCNYPKKIISAISESRCSVIEFKFSKNDIASLASQFMKRAVSILDENEIPYEKVVLAEVIKKYLPDWRRTLNELQRYSATGKIDSGILVDINKLSLENLVGFLKEKEFTKMRKWVAENIHSTDITSLYREIYDNASTFVDKPSIPMLVVILARYQYQHAFVADPEINAVACLTELMMDCRFV